MRSTGKSSFEIDYLRVELKNSGPVHPVKGNEGTVAAGAEGMTIVAKPEEDLVMFLPLGRAVRSGPYVDVAVACTVLFLLPRRLVRSGV